MLLMWRCYHYNEELLSYSFHLLPQTSYLYLIHLKGTLCHSEAFSYLLSLQAIAAWKRVAQGQKGVKILHRPAGELPFDRMGDG